MKNIIKIISVIVIFSGVTIFQGCTKEENKQINDQAIENQSPFEILSIDDVSVKENIIDWQINNYKKLIGNFKTSQDNNIEFNYNELFSAKMENVSGKVIVVNQTGFNVTNSVNHGIGFFENENGEIANALIIKLECVSENIRRIEYYNLNYELQLSVELDFLNKTSKIINQKENTLKFFSSGDDTMDCIEDVYTNHGWLSVWVSVQTAFIPATALAYALACAAIN